METIRKCCLTIYFVCLTLVIEHFKAWFDSEITPVNYIGWVAKQHIVGGPIIFHQLLFWLADEFQWSWLDGNQVSAGCRFLLGNFLPIFHAKYLLSGFTIAYQGLLFKATSFIY